MRLADFSYPIALAVIVALVATREHYFRRPKGQLRPRLWLNVLALVFAGHFLIVPALYAADSPSAALPGLVPTLLTRPTDYPDEVAVGADDRWFVTRHAKELRVWALADGHQLRVMPGHYDRITVHPKQPLLAAVERFHGMVIIWDVESGQVKQRLALSAWVDPEWTPNAEDISQAAKLQAEAQAMALLKFDDAKKGEGPDHYFRGMAPYHSGKAVVVLDRQQAKIFQLPERTLQAQYKLSTDEVHFADIRVTAAGELLLLQSADLEGVLFNTTHNRFLRMGKIDQDSSIEGRPLAILDSWQGRPGPWLQVLQDGSITVVAPDDLVPHDSAAKTPPVATTKRLKLPPEEDFHKAEDSRKIKMLHSSADGHWVVWQESFATGKQVVVWDTYKDELRLRYPLAGENSVADATLSADGRILAIATSDILLNRQSVFLLPLDLASAADSLRVLSAIDTQHCGNSPEFLTSIDTVRLSADSRLLACATHAGEVLLWNVEKRRLVHRLSGHTGGISALAFQPGGTLLASAGRDHTVRLWELSGQPAERSMITSWGEFPSEVTRLSFRADGGQLLAATEAGGVYLWDVQRPELRLTLSVRDKDWLALTPDGLCDGSGDRWDDIAWRSASSIADDIAGSRLLHHTYYPGLLKKVLGAAAPRLDVRVNKLQTQTPRVGLTLRSPLTPAAEQATLSIELTTPRGVIPSDLRLLRNGILIRRWPAAIAQSQEQRLEVSVPLLAGPNQFTAYVFNQSNVRSVEATLQLVGDSTLARRGTLHVVAIGINEYADATLKLRYAEADAAFLAAVLRGQRDGVVKNSIYYIPDKERDGSYEDRIKERKVRESRGPVHITLLRGPEASKKNILDTLARLAQTVKPADSVVIFFAGHGVAVDARFYLLPQEATALLSDPGPRAAQLKGAISDQELEAALASYDVSHIALIIDACQSGQVLTNDKDWRIGPINSRGLAQLAYEKGIHILTAAQSYQSAVEIERLGHGLLTYTLVEEGLKNGKASPSTVIDLQSWLRYAVERLPAVYEVATRRGVVATYATGGAAPGRPSAVQRPRLYAPREATLALVVGYGPLDIDPAVFNTYLDKPTASAPQSPPALPPNPGQRAGGLLTAETNQTMIGQVVFGPGDQWAAVVGWGYGTSDVAIWDVAHAVRLRTLPLYAKRTAPHPGGQLLAVADYDSVTVWNMAQSAAVYRTECKLEHDDLYPLLLMWLQNGQQLMLAGIGGGCIIDGVSGKLRQRVVMENKRCVGMSEAGLTVWQDTGRTSAVTLWDSATAQEKTLASELRGNVYQAVFEPHGNRLALAYGQYDAKLNKSVHVFDLRTLREQIKPLQRNATITAIAFSGDGKQLLAAGGRDGITRWDTRNFAPLGERSGGDKWTMALGSDTRGDVLITGDGSGQLDFNHSGRPADKVEQQRSWVKFPVLTARNQLEVVRVSAENKHFDFELWRLAPEEPRAAPFPIPWDPVSWAAQELWLGLYNDRHFQLWDRQTKRQDVELTAPANIDAAAISEDGRRVALAYEVGSDKTQHCEILVWERGKTTRTLISSAQLNCSALRFSPDGQHLTVLNGMWLHQFELDSGQEQRRQHEPRKKESTGYGAPGGEPQLVLSRTGDLIASEGEEELPITIVRLWDAKKLQPLRRLADQLGTIDDMIFSPNGQQLILALRNEVVQIRDLVGTAPVRVLPSDPLYYPTLSSSPDGNFLLVCDPRGRIMIWNLRTSQLVATVIWLTKAGAWYVEAPDGRFELPRRLWADYFFGSPADFTKMIPVAQRAASYTPGLLNLLLTTKPAAAAERAARPLSEPAH